MKKKKSKKGKINEKLKELVIARIDAQLPSNLKISIGGGGSLNKAEMIKHIKEEDEQGIQIIKMHVNFIKAVTSGQLMKEVRSI